MAYTTHADVKSLIGDNPFEKNEEDMIKQYNSSITLPLVLFLGIDEKKPEGFEHGIYKGKPYFAIDVTPKGSVEKEATGVIEAMKAKGLMFVEGRMHMSLNAPEGISPLLRISNPSLTHLSCNLRPSPRPHRLERPQPLLRWLWATHIVY